MEWGYIKGSIKKQLLERNLSNPNIRINALDRVEQLIDRKFLDQPILLLDLGKERLKNILSKRKKLNSAECSVINHIYDVLNGRHIPFRVPKK